MSTFIPVGSTVTCAETGKSFTVECDGFTFNYARDDAGNILSDEGVDLRERSRLLDRSKPFVCYLASDGKTITGWKGNALGTVVMLKEWRDVRRRECSVFTAVDVHGNRWTGRGAGRGMVCTLRAKA